MNRREDLTKGEGLSMEIRDRRRPQRAGRINCRSRLHPNSPESLGIEQIIRDRLHGS